jgi:hypothetical protein
MARTVLFAACLLLTACGGTAAVSHRDSSRPTPVPTAGVELAAGAAIRADDALRVAYAHADDRPLVGVLSGGALVAVRRDLAGMAARGVRREEQLDSRQLVHQSMSGQDAEVVLQVRVRQRLLAGAANPPFVNVLRQWRAHLHEGPEGWVVVDAQDLRPDQWWPVPQATQRER